MNKQNQLSVAGTQVKLLPPWISAAASWLGFRAWEMPGSTANHPEHGWLKNSPVCGVAGALPAAAEASQRGLIRPPHSLFHTRHFHEEGRLWAKYDFFFKFKN